MKLGEVQVTVIDMVTFVGMMITLFSSLLNLFQNRKSLYINNIIKYRLESIDELRNNICELMKLSNTANLNIMCSHVNNKMNFRSELEKCVTNIRMHLNFSKEIDKIIIQISESEKRIINNYLYMNYLKNIKTKENIEDAFIEMLNEINDKYFFQEIIKIKQECLDDKNRYELYKEVINLYKNNKDIDELLNCTESILNSYEDEIEKLNDKLCKAVHIYIEDKWKKCRIEMKAWPFNKFDEKYELDKLIKENHI